MTYQLSNNNDTNMAHILLLAMHVGSKELAIRRMRLDATLIRTDQTSDFVDKCVHGDWGKSFGSHNSFN